MSNAVAMKKFKEGDEDELVRKSIQREIKMLRMLRGPYVIDLKEAFKRYHSHQVERARSI
jgi:cyclin-dependent kinase-like